MDLSDATSVGPIYTRELDELLLSAEEQTVSDEESDEDFLTLRSETLNALNTFFDEKEAAREVLASLEIQLHPQGPQHDFQINEEELVMGLPSIIKSPELGVDTFKEAFKENWQLSQFWYSQDTAQRLAQAIGKSCPVGARVAFVCCPTGYVAFKESRPPTRDVLLLEYDTRFAIVAGTGFVRYDLDEPLSFPEAERLRSSVDIVVVDPPFHSELSQNKVSLTIAHILRPGGQIILLTGLALSPLIDTIYPSPPFPKLHRRDIVIEHDGVGRLKTQYGCWVGGEVDSGASSGFGEALDETAASL